MNALSQFYYLAHIFISLIGGVLLLAIYYNIRLRFRNILVEEDQPRVDYGLLYLSCALFVWVLAGTWSLLMSGSIGASSIIFQLGIYVFSIVNNMFLLLAIYYFHDAPSFVYKNQQNVRIIIGLILVVSLITIIITWFYADTIVYGLNVMALPDAMLSAFLSYLLVVSLYRTFVHRGLVSVALISVIVVVLIFTSQLPEVFVSMDFILGDHLIKLIAKTSLIFLFLVLATTWVIQLANTPKQNEMQLTFVDWSLIKLSIPSKNINDLMVDFGSKTTQYKNLLKFGTRRKLGSYEQQCILVGNGGEIRNQTYITRIIDNINEIAGFELEQRIERKDLFTFIGEGQYRLRILPEHINIEDALLKEFLAGVEHKDYLSLGR